MRSPRPSGVEEICAPEIPVVCAQAVIPPIGVGSQQRTVLGHAAREAVGRERSIVSTDRDGCSGWIAVARSRCLNHALRQ
jgi:hypothetical protein